MITIIKCIVFLVLVNSSVAQVETVELLDFASEVDIRLSTFPDGPIQFTAGGNYIAIFQLFEIRLIQRNERGLYDTERSLGLDSWTPYYLTTNGKWMGSVRSGNIPSDTVATFQIPPNAMITGIPFTDAEAKFMQFLGDDVLVAVSESFIQTYEFARGSWNMVHNQNVNFSVVTYFSFTNPQDTDSQPHVTDTTLAAFNPSTNNIELYTRDGTNKWNLVGLVEIDTSQYRANRIIWNGNDTVIIAHTTYVTQINNYGRLLVYTKAGGVWSMTQQIQDPSTHQDTRIGFSMLLIDTYLIAVGIPTPGAGEVWYLQKTEESTNWQVSLVFYGRPSRTHFGYHLQRNDHDLIVMTSDSNSWQSTRPVVIPSCYLPTPLTYNCSDLVLDQCDSGVELPYEKLYTVDECADVRLDNMLVTKEYTRVTFKFSSYYSGPFYCNATISCATSPVAAPETVDVPSQVPEKSPMATPTSNNTPSQTIIPIAAPKSDGKVMSGSGQRLVNAAAFLHLCSFCERCSLEEINKISKKSFFVNQFKLVPTMELKNSSYRTTPEQAIEIAKSQGHVYPSIIPAESAKPPAWSHNTKLSREELIDKIKGTIYGNAIGDAIGLSTEFLTGDAVKEFYKDKELSYANIIDDFHRQRWQRGDWTDDTDQMILIMDSLLANAGHINPADFAKRLRFWVDHGFAELGDLAGLGLGLTVKRVVSHKVFTENPHVASEEIYNASEGRAAANGAVMRTSVLGIPNFGDLNAVIENTTQIAKVTHFDPRCVASCIAGTTAIAMMLQGEHCSTKDEMKVICTKAIELARQVLKEHKEHDKEFTKLCGVKKIKDLHLDDRDSIGYTFKCVASGIFAVKYAKDFKTVITELVLEAGDADTNGAIAGALVGCRFGYSKLPKDWLEGLVNKKWLDARVEKFLKLLGLSE